MKKFNVHVYLQTQYTPNNIILLSLLHIAAYKVTEVWCFVFSLFLSGGMLTKFTSKNLLNKSIAYCSLWFPNPGKSSFLVDYHISIKYEWS